MTVFFTIGDWVVRARGGFTWHAVESVVAGAAVTRCGRRMEPTTPSGGDLVISLALGPWPRCMRCVEP